MTEYDYSPAAYERYVAQQARVSNWVDDTLQQAHAYSNPFVLSPTLRDRSFYDEPAPRHHRLDTYDEWSMSSSRPSRSRSRSYVDHAHYDRSVPPRYRSQSHSRSPPTPRDVQVIYPPHGSQPYYPQPHVAPRAPAPRIHTSLAHNYQYPSPTAPAHSPTRQTYVTQPPPGQIYKFSPNVPAPGSKDALHRHASYSRHPSSKPPPQPYLLVNGGGPKAEYKRGVRLVPLHVLVPVLIVLPSVWLLRSRLMSRSLRLLRIQPQIHAPIPTKPHAQQPLLKRLLGFVTMSPVGGRSGNGRGFRGSSY
ncbi:hypothetical protein J3R83DRAFT_3749 [Lanmaoa asiatica]|nr:hypothetical protein J3R83DRAFT_3749 [Lanmaoa asiatica]